MHYDETAVSFACAGDRLYGVLTQPRKPSTHQRGVLVVVGGPQYRAGSHRQFTLLARTLAGCGVATLRFDYRGMGDSEGAPRDFEQVHDDLRAAVDHFLAAAPQVREIVLWGLCDGASAALSYAGSDARVRALVLLNPWVRTDAGAARATLSHYYRQRLLAPDFWRKLLNGGLDAAASWRDWRTLKQAAGMSQHVNNGADGSAAALPDRMLRHWTGFAGDILLVLSGNDLVAREFADLAAQSPAWRRQLAHARVTRRDLADADHTFSRAAWRDQVATWTADWVRQC
jgi:exosortase A-associated hydrolase 1